jgi:ABC-2 type transport system permease protein
MNTDVLPHPLTFLRQSSLLAWRSLRAVPRVPERILDVTIQPIVFILLFRYVFGSAIHVTGISYVDFLVPGIIGQGLAFGLIGTGTATSHDMAEGVLDRFRSMPISRLSIVTGQVLGQYVEQVLGLCVYIALGLIVGWRPHLSVGTGFELAGLILLAVFAFTWAGAFFGMLVRSPDAMQGVGFIIIFPLSFMAGTFVPIAGMDLIPRTIGDWDPISALVATVRKLSTGYQASGSWLLDHCELAMLLWSLLLLAIFVPLALRRFNRTLAA